MPQVQQVISSLPPVPDPLNDDAATYSSKASAFTQALQTMAAQLQTWTNQVNAIAVGAAYGLSYVYSATTTAADPGAGKLRLNNAALGSTTAL